MAKKTSGAIRSGNENEADESARMKEMKDRSRSVLLSIGRRIYELRAESGMTQRTLEDRSGVAQGFISEIENGNGNPTWERLSAICHALGITFPELVVQALFRNIEVQDDTLKTASTVSRILQEVLEKDVQLAHKTAQKDRQTQSRK